ncbi:uncharacterized protein BO95DRAFT_368468 [Aspergillus brunneoviolaceus CBS 621.78]|uniref:Uncharacterized protein n=1 Tax=Aspergillus brunneoviolaceus CBS 621.78 TaxID=1450534 RepID=A0ACD1G2T1_9EURO|nr:hypothetical protein BO95DRAFT_368468 [Aspergillus brunneoviolaceus CBS 621.78]RAH43520.1 hypothetical protein BO95DRAFT_368468 [Aspergillus brunneoviolaceus CBS 621.78]
MLGYQFQIDETRLIEALTAPGAEGEERQGNRYLADFGLDTIRSCVAFDGYKKKVKPSNTASLKQRICSYSHLQKVAEHTGFDECIIYNPRSGKGRPVVVGKALAAAIGAAHLDNGWNYERTLNIIYKLGLLTDNDNGVDSQLLRGVQSEIPSELNVSDMSFTMTAATIEVVDYSVTLINENGEDTSVSVVTGARDDVHLAVLPANGAQEAPLSASSGHPSKRENGNMPQDSDTNMPTKKRPQKEDSRLRAYLECEESRCANHGLPLPHETYYTENIQATLRRQAKSRNLITCQRLILCVGSAESLITLREAIKFWREKTIQSLGLPLQALTARDLLRLIESNAETISYHLVLQRYYILELFKKSGGTATPSCTGFLAVDYHGINLSRKPGNPVHSMDADVSKRILQEVEPLLDGNSPQYKNRLETIKTLRALGMKYHILTSNFGPGILALIPSSEQVGQIGVTISAPDISRLPISLFKDVISILNETQRLELRKLSQAVWDKLKDMLVHSGNPGGRRLWLETIESSDLLRFPKSSPILERLFDWT